jgi:hypothetical protein
MKIKKYNFQRGGPNTRVGTDILLDYLRKSASQDLNENPLLPSYIMSVCATIEGRVNDAFIKYFEVRLGESYKPHAKPFLQMNMESKLRLLFPMLTNYKLEVNFQNLKLKYLLKLFRLRNRLVHQQNHLEPALFIDYQNGTADIKFEDENEWFYHSHEEWPSISKKDLVQIHKTLKFWVVWLFDITIRINRKNFNSKDILKPIIL